MSQLFKPTRCALAVALLSLPALASANQSLVAPGFSLTTGGVTSQRSVHTSANNPASTNLIVRDGERFRFGYFANLGGYIEIGEVDDLDLKLDDLVDDLDALDTLDSWSSANLGDRQSAASHLSRYGAGCNVDPSSGSIDGNTLAACYQAIADNINGELLEALEQGGQIRAGFHASAPLMPFVFSSQRDWSLGFNVSASGQMRGAFIGDRFGVRTNVRGGSNQNLGSVQIDAGQIGDAYVGINAILDNDGLTEQQQLEQIRDYLQNNNIVAVEDLADINQVIADLDSGALNPNDIELEAELTTDSSFDVRAAGVAQLSISYAHNLTSAFELNPTYGTLEAGARLNYYHAEMFRNLVSFRGIANDDDDSDDDALDTALDDFRDQSTTSGALGLDVGLLWHADNYQLGLTLYNLNEPEFDYPDLGSFLDSREDDFEAAQNLQRNGRLSLAESVTLTRHAVVEGAYFSQSRNWVVQGYYTLGTATNFVGDEFQNMGVSAGYFTNSWWLPGVRAGYNKNLTGTELSTVHFGTTLFGIFNLDAAMSTQTSSFDGNDIPRYLAFSIGFEEKF
ncbi:conjugal transfer protein TraF [Marinospirillum sp. MEB164]|uniref:Conjugal transfer protein TraF n=1 Tax=Marinospirillum alkalitolerans TaxID=3123374 RepID=A0ABW8PYG9_9GAMM